jgi:Histone chaperone Rttp106-like
MYTSSAREPPTGSTADWGAAAPRAGTLYPLERGLLYTFKPEFVPLEHIESVEFERQGDALHVAQRTFDLSVTVKAAAATRTKHFLYRCAPARDGTHAVCACASLQPAPCGACCHQPSPAASGC